MTLSTLVGRLTESIGSRRRSEATPVARESDTANRGTSADLFRVLSKAAELRDDVTSDHCTRVGALSTAMARELGLEEPVVQRIGAAAALHDIGKIGVPDRVLCKPGKLDAHERGVIEEHCVIGHRILSGASDPMLALAASIALHHHEAWDGSGYPTGLCGKSIPIEARIVSLADFLDAVTHERPYKRGWTMDEALREVDRLSGTKFDPAVVAALLRALERDGSYGIHVRRPRVPRLTDRSAESRPCGATAAA